MSKVSLINEGIMEEEHVITSNRILYNFSYKFKIKNSGRNKLRG